MMKNSYGLALIALVSTSVSACGDKQAQEPETVSVRMPDGTIIENVPKGTSKMELVEKLERNGYDTAHMLSAEQQTFHGYSCTDDCSGHQAGYDWAEENSIYDPDDCSGNSESFIEGCRAYGEELGY